jgi:hypothetical protein
MDKKALHMNYREDNHKAPEQLLFISYAHEDARYVDRLAGHLHSSGLPTWHDADLRWGERFPQALSRQLASSLAIIVVMSATAARSAWVEREILEGQRCDRLFLPVLLDGDRFFLLAASKYFDARNGNLPGDPELRQLRQLAQAGEAGVSPRPALDLRAPTDPGAMAAQRPPANIGLGRLRALLADGRIEHADILTTSVLLSQAGRADNGWLRRRDGGSIPACLLDDIDAIWSASSGGAYGFGAQLALHPVPPRDAPSGGQRDFSALALAVSWKNSPREAIPRYQEFVDSAQHPAGFFPTLRNPLLERYASWHDFWAETVMAVHTQFRKWSYENS